MGTKSDRILRFQDDIERLQPYAFLMIDDFSNRRTSCRSRFIPRLDLNKWRETPLNTPPSDNRPPSIRPPSIRPPSIRPPSHTPRPANNPFNFGSSSFKESPEGGVLLQAEEALDSPVQNSAFLALKKVSSLFSASSRGGQQESAAKISPPPPPLSLRPPLNPLSAYYLHAQEVPSRPAFSFGGIRAPQPRNKLQAFIESVMNGEDFLDGGGDDEGDPSTFSVVGDDDDDDSSFVITQDKMSSHLRESLPFTSEVPRQLTREQYYRFYDGNNVGGVSDDQEEEERSSSSSSSEFVEALFSSLLKADDDGDDDDAGLRPFAMYSY